METKTPNTREEQDEAHNPGANHAAAQLSNAETAAGQAQVENSDNQSVNQGIKKQEEDPPVRDGFYRPSPGGKEEKVTIKSVFKKKGPMGIIIGLLFGGGAGFSLMLAPGIGIVQLKEVMTDDLNDQLSALDIRSEHLLRSKLSGMQKGLSICADAVKIRCKFSSMSDRQVKKFEKSGFQVERADSKIPTRNKILSLTGPDGTKITDPNSLRRLANSNPSIRGALIKAYNPKFRGFTDKVSQKVLSALRIDKTKKVSGTTDEERNRNMANATNGPNATLGVNADGQLTDDQGKKYVVDENGNNVYDDNKTKFDEISAKNKAGLDKITSKVSEVKATGIKSTKSMLKSGAKGVSLLGAADTACTVYNVGRAVAAAAKVTRAMQLAQFAMVFLNTADAIKAGDAQPEDVEYIGNKIAAVDMNKEIYDESTIQASQLIGGDASIVTGDPKPNPFYGKNAFDSPGYAIAAYNDAPTLTSRSLQYTVGGGLTGSLSSVMDMISNKLGSKEEIRSTCKVVQSWWARGLGLIAGLIVGAGSFGVTTGLSIAASVAIGFALPFLEASLADIIAGKTVGPDTDGPDVGDAVFAGSGVMMGDMAMARGMQPASSDQLKAAQGEKARVQAKYVAYETEEAKSTPLDVMNQYSFLGSVVRSINPTVLKTQASIASSITGIPSLVGSAFSGLIPHTSAAQVFNAARFNKCNDPAYEDIGINADVFCNVRYVMTPQELNMDPLEAVDYMLNSGQISDEGEPIGKEYKAFIAGCVERTAGWGETTKDDSVGANDIGAGCKDGSSSDVGGILKYFRVYTMDKGINDDMDDDGQSTAVNGGGSQVVVTGDARALALQVANNPNVRYVNTATKEQLIIFGNGGEVTDGCGAPFTVSKYLLSAILANSNKYSILINNIGFRQDRDMCESETYQHPKGTAMDLNDIQIIGGESTGGSIELPGPDLDIVNQYATDFLAALPLNRGGVGQSDHGVKPTFPDGSIALNGSHLFPDAGNHLHIDARNRQNLYDTE